MNKGINFQLYFVNSLLLIHTEKIVKLFYFFVIIKAS